MKKKEPEQDNFSDLENAELYSSQDEKDNNQEIHIRNEP